MNGADGDAGYDDSMDDSAGDPSGGGSGSEDVASQVDSFSEFSSGNFQNANFGGAPAAAPAIGSAKVGPDVFSGKVEDFSSAGMLGGTKASTGNLGVQGITGGVVGSPTAFDMVASAFNQPSFGGQPTDPSGMGVDDGTPDELKPRKSPIAKVATTTSSNKASLNIPTRRQIRRAAVRYI